MPSDSPPRWEPGIERKMRDEWDARAQENPFYYIASSKRDWDREEFFTTGRESVLQLVVEDAETICKRRRAKRMRVLEIGCGAGRMTRALAEFFGEVHGVDVSGEMIRLGRELLAGVPNAHLHHGTGVDLKAVEHLRFDFAFSFIVFQHIPDKHVIENYIRETARLLEPGGLFKFQLQGYTGFQSPPGDTWLGASFDETEARGMVRRAGLDLRRIYGAGSQYFWLWARKPTAWERLTDPLP